jgi:RNA methyltransferase, TrmH family
MFVAEGIRSAEELLASRMRVVGALVSARLLETPRGVAVRTQLDQSGASVLDVSEADFTSAADTESPQGILVIAEVPRHSFDSIDLGPVLRLLVLDGLQDPGNVGTILRTAAALGVTATTALPGTVDLWNAKVVRSGMGAHFHHLCFDSTWDELDAFRASTHTALWGTEASGEPVEPIRAPERLALVVGNEGGGLSPAARARVERLVALPIGSAVESLNVAVATGIFLYLLRR